MRPGRPPEGGGPLPAFPFSHGPNDPGRPSRRFQGQRQQSSPGIRPHGQHCAIGYTAHGGPAPKIVTSAVLPLRTRVLLRTTTKANSQKSGCLMAIFPHSPPLAELLERVRERYRDMPGLTLTKPQATRLFEVAPSVCAAMLRALVMEEYLSRTGDGLFVKSITQ